MAKIIKFNITKYFESDGTLNWNKMTDPRAAYIEKNGVVSNTPVDNAIYFDINYLMLTQTDIGYDDSFKINFSKHVNQSLINMPYNDVNSYSLIFHTESPHVIKSSPNAFIVNIEKGTTAYTQISSFIQNNKSFTISFDIHNSHENNLKVEEIIINGLLEINGKIVDSITNDASDYYESISIDGKVYSLIVGNKDIVITESQINQYIDDNIIWTNNVATLSTINKINGLTVLSSKTTGIVDKDNLIITIVFDSSIVDSINGSTSDVRFVIEIVDPDRTITQQEVSDYVDTNINWNNNSQTYAKYEIKGSDYTTITSFVHGLPLFLFNNLTKEFITSNETLGVGEYITVEFNNDITVDSNKESVFVISTTNARVFVNGDVPAMTFHKGEKWKFETGKWPVKYPLSASSNLDITGWPAFHPHTKLYTPDLHMVDGTEYTFTVQADSGYTVNGVASVDYKHTVSSPKIDVKVTEDDVTKFIDANLVWTGDNGVIDYTKWATTGTTLSGDTNVVSGTEYTFTVQADSGYTVNGGASVDYKYTPVSASDIYISRKGIIYKNGILINQRGTDVAVRNGRILSADVGKVWIDGTLVLNITSRNKSFVSWDSNDNWYAAIDNSIYKNGTKLYDVDGSHILDFKIGPNGNVYHISNNQDAIYKDNVPFPKKGQYVYGFNIDKDDNYYESNLNEVYKNGTLLFRYSLSGSLTHVIINSNNEVFISTTESKDIINKDGKLYTLPHSINYFIAENNGDLIISEKFSPNIYRNKVIIPEFSNSSTDVTSITSTNEYGSRTGNW